MANSGNTIYGVNVIGLKSTHLKFHCILPGHNELTTLVEQATGDKPNVSMAWMRSSYPNVQWWITTMPTILICTYFPFQTRTRHVEKIAPNAPVADSPRTNIIMTSSHGNIFRVTGLLCVEFSGHRWIPRTKASDAELWCFLWSAPWINNREAGDMRRYRAHYDVIVMWQPNKTHLNDGNTIATIDCMHDSSSGPA